MPTPAPSNGPPPRNQSSQKWSDFVHISPGQHTRKPTALDMPSIVLSNRPSLGESTRRCYYHAAERWGFFSLLMRSDDGRSKFQRSYHLDQMLWALDRGLPGSTTTATLSRRETRVGESRTETEIRGVPKGMGPTEIAASGATSSVTC